MYDAFWPYGPFRSATLPAQPRLCCPFSASRCQRLANNCDHHLFNRIDEPRIMRRSGGSCGSRHWVRVGRIGAGACARPFGGDIYDA